jgi:hypothetical protein
MENNPKSSGLYKRVTTGEAMTIIICEVAVPPKMTPTLLTSEFFGEKIIPL